VVNSSVTFCVEALLNNANQIPKLPGWAVIDLNSTPDAARPRKVLDAGSFDERWQAAHP